MNHLRSALTLSLLLTASARCGGDTSPFGPPPSEATLCRIAPGRSTEQQAKAILGQPTSESNLPHHSSFTYSYDPQRPGAGYGAVTLEFEDGVLRQGSTQNLPLPACWKSTGL